MLSWDTLFSALRPTGERGGRGGAGDWGEGEGEWDGDTVGDVDVRRMGLRAGSGGGGFGEVTGGSLLLMPELEPESAREGCVRGEGGRDQIGGGGGGLLECVNIFMQAMQDSEG
jgi:hypothetical protein